MVRATRCRSWGFTALVSISALSFLGLGIQEPLTSWGVLISQGADQMEAAPWILVFPSLFMAATLLAFNFVGDGLRDALDPRLRGAGRVRR